METGLGSVQVAGAGGSLALFLAVAYLLAEFRLFWSRRRWGWGAGCGVCEGAGGAAGGFGGFAFCRG